MTYVIKKGDLYYRHGTTDYGFVFSYDLAAKFTSPVQAEAILDKYNLCRQTHLIVLAEENYVPC